MAETVSLHIENMLPELEQMKRIGLFKPEEINDIIKKRKEFEYKIERTVKEKQDFLRYINYEVKLLREIKLRRDKQRISEKKNEIEYAIAKRIVKLYQMVLSYFKSDVRMWVSYINFCTQTKFSSVVSQAFKQMLQVHSEKKELWSFASRWELFESNNIEGALNYLKTGLHHHPNAPELYTEAFRLELKAVEKLDKNDAEKQEKGARRALEYFRAAVDNVGNDTEFIINLLNIATEYDFTESLQRDIVDYMTKICWRSELMWHTMAQRELNGHNFNKNDMHKSTTQLCIAVYKSAVRVLPTTAMWEKYLDALIDIYHDERRSNNIKFSVLESAFEEAYNKSFLLEKHYLIWLEKLDGDAKYYDILTRATKAIPNSVDLWLIRIRHHITHDDATEIIRQVANDAIKCLGKDSLQIYRALIEYYLLKQGHTAFSPECKKVFEEGISQTHTEISLPLRPQYLEWLCLTRSLKLARFEYEKLQSKLPFCLEMHKKMVELEMSRYSPSVPHIRNIYKIACRQFGKEKTDIWMEYIKFEREMGEPLRVSEVYETAKNTLNENLVSIFTTDFAIMNSQ